MEPWPSFSRGPKAPVVVIDPRRLRVLEMKEFGEESRGASSLVPDRVWALRRRLSIVFSSSVFETEVECSLLR